MYNIKRMIDSIFCVTGKFTMGKPHRMAFVCTLFKIRDPANDNVVNETSLPPPAPHPFLLKCEGSSQISASQIFFYF